VGDDVYTETEAYEAYLRLKKDVEAELKDRAVELQLDSAFRSTAAQQKIVDEFTEKYGEEYVKNYVAVPGYSEHHTGLALDLYFTIGDKTVYENEDLVQYPEIWAAIHEKLPEYGFILRFPEGKEKITGVSYEPWHLRYIDSPETAKEITEKGITLEEYLADNK
jgi:D-alanyl-D-alanine carboxypeptidase